MRMDILAEILKYDLLGIFFARGIIPELDEYPAVFVMGLEGEYLEAIGIDLREEIAKLVENGGFACIADVYPWAAVRICWVLSLTFVRVVNSLQSPQTNWEDRIDPQATLLRLDT